MGTCARQSVANDRIHRLTAAAAEPALSSLAQSFLTVHKRGSTARRFHWNIPPSMKDAPHDNFNPFVLPTGELAGDRFPDYRNRHWRSRTRDE